MILAIIVFLFIIGLLVLVHESGHFFTAKKLGVKVEEFGLGLPPRIWGKKKGETIYSINAIPFGGFVKLYGEDEVGKNYLKDPKSFNSKSLGSRALIISAGVIANILFAAALFYFLVGFNGFSSYQPLIMDYEFPFGEQQNLPFIVGIAENSPAEKAGLKSNSVILGADGKIFQNTESFIDFIHGHKGKEISLRTKNLATKSVKEITITPRTEYSEEKEGPLGVSLRDIAELNYSKPIEKFTVGFLHTFNIAHYSFTALGYFIKTSIIEKTIQPLASSVTGPIGILAVTKLTIKAGIISVLELIAFISLALGIFNILPLPALDGGRLAFIAFEAVTRKKIPQKIEKTVNTAGFIALIMLLILVTYKDIVQFKDILF